MFNQESAVYTHAFEETALLDNIDSAIIGLSPSHRITYVNPAGQKLLGNSKAYLTGRTLRETVPESLMPLLLKELDCAAQSNSAVGFEACFPALPDIMLSCKCLPLKDGFVLLLQSTSSLSDICSKNIPEQDHLVKEALEPKDRTGTGDEHRTTKILEDQKELLQKIIDTIPVMLCFFCSTGRARLVNKEFERVIGWNLEEFKGRDILAACFSDPSKYNEARTFLTGSEPGWRDFEARTRSGDCISTSWASVCLSDNSHIGIGIDISARKKLEHSLLQLASAIDQAGEGIILFSPSGIIEYLNPAYEELSGFKRHELIGERADIFCNSYDEGIFYELISDVTSPQKRFWKGRTKRKKKNGEIIDIFLSSTQVRNADGEVTNYVSVVRDITNEQKLQNHLCQIQKMEAIWNMAGGVAHDLKNVLMPIMINLELAMEHVPANSPVYPFLTDSLSAARFGSELIKQIMSFNRKADRDKKPVAIPAIVHETIPFLKSSIPSDIEIDSFIDDDSALTLADPVQIKQVLINLGNNAAYAMKEKGGCLGVHLSSVDLDQEAALKISPALAPGSYFRIIVSDTGTGIEDKILPRIFDPFFTTKKIGEGSGLGLAVVHGIVKDHHGAITAQSTLGKGSSFSVYLPKLNPDPAG